MPLPDLQTILASVKRLDSLLTDEFEALKTQRLEAFEALQQEKTSLLHTLSASGIPTATNETANRDVLTQLLADPLWSEITDLLETCKKKHQRTELLISKQLDVIKGALTTLQDQDPSGTLELYTKLGRVKSSRRSILSGDA